jgi:hypothetical protein
VALGFSVVALGFSVVVTLLFMPQKNQKNRPLATIAAETPRSGRIKRSGETDLASPQRSLTINPQRSRRSCGVRVIF